MFDEVKLNRERGSVWTLSGRKILSPPLVFHKYPSVLEEEFGKRAWEMFHSIVSKEAERMTYKFLDSAPVSKYLREKNPGLEEVIKLVLGLLEAEGHGVIELVDCQLPEKSATLRVVNSPMSEEYKERIGESSRPVCDYSAAVFSGVFSAIYGRELACVEVKCSAMGEEYCEFKVILPEKKLDYQLL